MLGSAQCSVLSGNGNRQRSTCNARSSVVAFFLCPPGSGFSRPRRPARCGFSRFQRIRTQSRSAGLGSFCGLFWFSNGLVSGRVPSTDSPCPAVSGARRRPARRRRRTGRGDERVVVRASVADGRGIAGQRGGGHHAGAGRFSLGGDAGRAGAFRRESVSGFRAGDGGRSAERTDVWG